MKKGKLAKILIFTGLGLFIFVDVFLLLLPSISAIFFKYSTSLLFIYNGGDVILLYVFGIIIPFALIFSGAIILGSLSKKTYGKIFIVRGIKKDKHRGYIYLQGTKFWVYSSDELNDEDHVKITGSELIPAGQYSRRILMCKKLELNDPEYYNLEDSQKNY